jgi:hypothetical protein
MLKQAQRIEEDEATAAPPEVRIRLIFSSDEPGIQVLHRVRQVMHIVALAQEGSWPTDEEWEQLLPGWFLESFEGHSMQELISRPELWGFGSWLDAMRNPGWEWWSCSARDRGGLIRAFAYSDPFAIEPLMYLLRVAGAKEVQFEEG